MQHILYNLRNENKIQILRGTKTASQKTLTGETGCVLLTYLYLALNAT